MSDDKTWYGDDVDAALEKALEGSDLLDDAPTTNVGIDPFAAALADMVGGNITPDLEDVMEGELDALLFDDDGDENPQYGFKGAPREPNDHSDVIDHIVTPEGVIGIDPFADDADD